MLKFVDDISCWCKKSKINLIFQTVGNSILGFYNPIPVISGGFCLDHQDQGT